MNIGWRCGLCYAPNITSALKCVVCDSPPQSTSAATKGRSVSLCLSLSLSLSLSVSLCLWQSVTLAFWHSVYVSLLFCLCVSLCLFILHATTPPFAVPVSGVPMGSLKVCRRTAVFGVPYCTRYTSPSLLDFAHQTPPGRTQTFELFADPVITPQGHTFEREALVDHIRRTGTCPLSREPLTEASLVTNRCLRAAVAAWEDYMMTGIGEEIAQATMPGVPKGAAAAAAEAAAAVATAASGAGAAAAGGSGAKKRCPLCDVINDAASTRCLMCHTALAAVRLAVVLLCFAGLLFVVAWPNPHHHSPRCLTPQAPPGGSGSGAGVSAGGGGGSGSGALPARPPSLQRQLSDRAQALLRMTLEEPVVGGVPRFLCCPISLSASAPVCFTDPVVTPFGDTYERALLLQALEDNGGVDPLTKRPLQARQLVPNRALKSAAEAFMGALHTRALDGGSKHASRPAVPSTPLVDDESKM